MRLLAVALLVSVDPAGAETHERPLTVQELLRPTWCDRLALPTDDLEIAGRIAASRGVCYLREQPSVGEAESMLGSRPIAISRDGDILTIVARSHAGPARICCSLQATLGAIGPDLYGNRFLLQGLDSGILRLMLSSIEGSRLEYRGPHAPIQPARAKDLAGSLKERTVWSAHLREARKVTIYLPPSHSAGRSYPLLVLADGQWLRSYAKFLDPLILAGQLPGLVMVGVHSGSAAVIGGAPPDLPRDLRGLEYLPEEAPERFAAHLRFVADEIVPMAVAELSADPAAAGRIVFGASNGGAFAVNAALRRPDIFGAAIALSFGRRPVVEQTAPPNGARFYLSAGLYEPAFRFSTIWSADALRSAGYVVWHEEAPGGHDQSVWEPQLVAFLQAALADSLAGRAMLPSTP